MAYPPKGRGVSQKIPGDLFLLEGSANQSELQSVKQCSCLTLAGLGIVFRARQTVSMLSAAAV